MKFVFDAVFLDKDLKVVHLMRDMPAWRPSKMVWQAKSVLELPAGMIAQTGTELGDQFEMRREEVSAAVAEIVSSITLTGRLENTSLPAIIRSNLQELYLCASSGTCLSWPSDFS